MINFDKFLASFITEMKKYSPITSYNIPVCIKKALKDQGLEYKDGEIVKAQDKISTESKDEKIRKGLIENFKWFCGDYPETSKWGKDDNLLVKDIIAWLEKQGKPKFKIGDIISNGKVIYRIDGITKNCLGQDCYFLVNIEDEEKGLRKLIITDPEGKHHYFGETEWLCEQVDRQFKKKELKKIEQKSTWGKEDESMYVRTLGVLGKCYMGELPTKVEEELNWFKSIRTKIKGE